ncbi:DsbA family oxidoreductase [Candidatus Halocynthiibacter alkanivorans]|uniref:DsbA family oxidoreductase n=1 Tax=Candidatus Halocynthiibacter alkanivorans TaxID=2267619 RepID=UPI000DF2D54C|nr:DsbA family oxidoreductase [Candidatus Halocynthiibacter alkanivorans]
MVKLDIISDPICPWCFIGKARLDRALEAHPDHPFQIEWHPFQLNPDMPAEGMGRRDYLEHKFGGRDGALKAYAPVLEAAEDAGLKIDFSAIERTPNTLNAHRLIHWAGLESRQTPVVAALFKAYFVEGRDIGDIDVLCAIAARFEMDEAATRLMLQGNADAELIRQRDAHARERGISGVPMFIVDNQHAVSGAQPAELWTRVIADITAKEDAAES